MAERESARPNLKWSRLCGRRIAPVRNVCRSSKALELPNHLITYFSTHFKFVYAAMGLSTIAPTRRSCTPNRGATKMKATKIILFFTSSFPPWVRLIALPFRPIKGTHSLMQRSGGGDCPPVYRNVATAVPVLFCGGDLLSKSSGANELCNTTTEGFSRREPMGRVYTLV